MWYNEGMDITTWLKDWALPLSSGATFLLALAAFGAIWQSHCTRKKDFKTRLLDKIVEWIIEIQKTSLEIDVSFDKEKIETSILLRYGIPFIKNDYIKAIVGKEFNAILKEDVENMIRAFTAFLICSTKIYGCKDEDIEKSFKGEIFKSILQGIKEELREKPVQELWEKYAVEKSRCANGLLNKIGDIFASL